MGCEDRDCEGCHYAQFGWACRRVREADEEIEAMQKSGKEGMEGK